MSSQDQALANSRQPTGTVSGMNVRLNTAWFLLHYFCTGLPLIKVLWYLAVLLLPVSVISSFWSPYFAFGLGVYCCIGLLGFPFLVAVPQQRMLLGNRRLTLVPGFPLTSGLVLFVMGLLLAVFIPMLALAYGIPGAGSLLSLRIFIVVSLYVAILHICLVSNQAVFLMSFLPLIVITALNQFEAFLSPLWAHQTFMLVLALVCLAVWILALFRLHVSSSFKAPFQQVGTLMMGYEYNQQFAPLSLAFLSRRIAIAPSLLLGFAASTPNRVLNMLTIGLVSPAICSWAMLAIWNDGDNGKPMPGFAEMLLFFHLFMAATYPWSWGELAARTRLLWLRKGNNRMELWHFMEGQLWTQYSLLFLCTFILVLLLLASQSQNPLNWPILLLAVSFSIHSGYMKLLERLRFWGIWEQALSMIAVMIVVTVAVVTSLVINKNDPILGVSAILLSLTLWYRWQCMKAFITVDWLKLKPIVMRRRSDGAV